MCLDWVYLFSKHNIQYHNHNTRRGKEQCVRYNMDMDIGYTTHITCNNLTCKHTLMTNLILNNAKPIKQNYTILIKHEE